MVKIQFKNLPDTTTPVNADNLNAIQTNTENAINEVDGNIDLATKTTLSTTSGKNQEITGCAGASGKINIESGETYQAQYNGYNLFNYYSYPATETKNGITITNLGNGYIKLDGTCTANNTTFNLGTVSTITEYTTSSAVTHRAYYVSGTCTKSTTTNVNTVLRVNYNQSSSMIHFETLDATNPTQTKTQPQLPSSTTGFAWQIKIDNDDVFDNFIFRYQLEKSSEAHDFEPYVGRKSCTFTKFSTRYS